MSETFGVIAVGLVEGALTVPVDDGTASGVAVCWGNETNTAVVMIKVVPLNKPFTMRYSVIKVSERSWPIGPVFQRFEPCFSVGVIV